MANPTLERKIQRLLEMGVSRSAAKSALKASKLDVEEQAASVVFDDRHADAMDIPSDDEALTAGTSRAPSIKQSQSNASTDNDTARDKGKGKQVFKQPTPADDDEELPDDDEPDADEDYDEYPDTDHEDLHDDSDAGDVDHGDGDAYGFVNMSKDRQETITEVEEPIRTVHISLTARGDKTSAYKGAVEAELFGQQRWMSGCPEGNEQQQLFPLYNMLAGNPLTPSKCPYNCGNAIKHHESDFFAVTADFKQYIDRLAHICVTACTKCGQSVCLACNEPTIVENLAVGEPAPSGVVPEVLLHCANLQAVILGVGLFMADNIWDALVAASTDNPAPSDKTRKRKSSGLTSPSALTSTVSGMIGRSGQNYYKAGVGYGGVQGGRDDDQGQKAALKQQRDRDRTLSAHLALVRVYLPNRDRPGSFKNSDHMPAGQTLAHLRRRFNPIASLLLSAESLSDMSERKELYTEFMLWLEIMSAHENLAGLMGQPIMRASSTTYTETDGKAKANQAREKVIVFSADPSPRESLETILRQVEVAKRVSDAARARDDVIAAATVAGSTPTAPGSLPQMGLIGATTSPNTAQSTSEAQRLVEFCDIITKAVGKIDKSLRQTSRGKAVLKAIAPKSLDGAQSESADAASLDVRRLSDDDLVQRYVAWAKECNYSQHDWERKDTDGAAGMASLASLGPSYKHVYDREARVITSSTARNTAMMKEHTVLSSSLPSDWASTVFLKVDENRPDIIKAMIVGPSDTPYENGCFFFDILLGSTYNSGPPNVKSLTSKGGRFRLNPNLYAEGKVCLSLLGTWSGPGWVAGKSTLLQVLVSIQAMILWAEPIANEPSFERELGTARSKAYNANVRRMVANIAMLEYLKTPPEGFEDIVETHFRLKARSLAKQLDAWLRDDDRKPLAHDSMSSIDRGYGHGAVSPHTPASGTNTPTSASSSAGSAFAADVEAIKKYLAKLESGERLAEIVV